MNKKILLYLLVSLMSSATLPSASFASAECPTLRVAAAEIPYFVESAEKGEFVELIRSAAARANLDLTIQVFPKKRALSLFQLGRVDALVPHSSAGKEVVSYKSLPILTKRDFVFVRKGTPVPASIKELEGLRIGLTRQYAYPKSLTSNKKVEFSRAPNSDRENIKMLSLGRLDGSIIEERSGLRAIMESGASNIVYDKNHPINELLVWVLFSRNKCGQYFMEKINSEFNAMKLDGEWYSIKGISKPDS
ncbi:MAG: transporter substrate-binding domain-containing protein [Roseibium sp.]